jgi:putative redox protein
MVPISIAYRGELRCHATHGPSLVELLTDAPVDNHGKGQSFSPTDLLATGYATCILTTMAIVAGRDGIALDGARVAVEKHMTATAPRRIAMLVARLSLPASVPVDARAKLERAGHACPVALSLHPDVQQVVEFTWG